jgi:hypothetical protein
MHGLITGSESRQQLYTMCTRGRLSNHIYLQLVGDGDPHTLIRPDNIRPPPEPSCSNRSLPETTPQDPPPLCCETSTIPPYGSATPSDATSTPRWRHLLATDVPGVTADPFLPELEGRLTNLTGAGFDAALLVRSAAAAGPLPDDHPAAALWWRILDQLPQTPNQEPGTPDAVPATRRTTMTSHDKQPPRLRSAPPPAFGPSR